MHPHDETNDKPAVSAAESVPVADFGRRRVSRILKRERPRGEQHSRLEFDVGNIVFDIMKNSPWKGTTSLHLNDGRFFAVFCNWRRHHIWAGRLIAICWKLRKGRTANLNSRFLGRPR